MFLCARNIQPDDRETMVRLFLPPAWHSEAERNRERERWDRLWAAELPEGIVIEDLSESGDARAVGVMVAAPVLPEVTDRLAAPDGPHLLDGLADTAESRGGAPDETALGRANAGEGVDLVVCWVGYGDAERSPEAFAKVRGSLFAAFHDLVGGNRLRRITFEAPSEKAIEWFDGYGFERLREEDGAVVLSIAKEEAIGSDDLANQRFFSYEPPILGFSSAQRAILRLARQGHTDQEIADRLGRTTDSVKKRWGGIYARFAHAFPGRLPEGREGSRGAEKRRTLLAYLKDRPEELRPYEGEEERGKREEDF